MRSETTPARAAPVAPEDIEVIAPNFKRRLSGVTATVVRLVPIQAHDIGIVASGPVIPAHVPQIPLLRLITLPRRGPGPNGTRVWHARRNVEMIGGIFLRNLLRKRLKLMFTSASQRRQTGLTRWLIRRMDAVVATSEKTAEYLEVPAEVIMHGIDLQDFSPPKDRAKLRRHLDVSDQGPVIGCYGRIREQKGTDVYVKAMIGLLQRLPTATALVMGRATEAHRAFENELKSQIAAAGLTGRLRFMPEVPTEQMADWYRILDLYVAPQRWEGFGLTPIEAMACGCPVVATRVGAFEALVADGQTGTLVDAGDADAIQRAAFDILSNPEKHREMMANARAHVMQHFSIATEAAALVAVYRRLLASA